MSNMQGWQAAPGGARGLTPPPIDDTGAQYVKKFIDSFYS